MDYEIGIIDYGMGNIYSIYKKTKDLNKNLIVTNDPEIIKNVKKIILPDVGHFLESHGNLKKLNLIDPLNHAVLI